jgi:hypothetical protein
MFIALMIIYVIILLLEVIPIYRNKRKKELKVFMLFSSAALILNLLIAFQVKIPSPSAAIKDVVLGIMGK